MGLKPTPLAVIAGDIHYSLPTLETADKATRMAIEMANKLRVPFIANGDTHDSKAHLRGECVKAMIETFKLCEIPAIINIGNHDKINAKSVEHSLEFLTPYASIVKYPARNFIPYWTIIPYHDDVNELRKYLKTLKPNSNLIMHQGITGSNSGEYIKDHSALFPEDVKSFRIIASHYHQRQTIDLLDDGKWDFIGNPYTVTFGEANDPEKGFQVLYDDGSLEFVPTYLRRHQIIDVTPATINTFSVTHQTPDDLYWIKVKGPSDWLSTITREQISKRLTGWQFRLDLIPNEIKTTLQEENVEKCSQLELLDRVIDSLTNTDEGKKTRLKSLWKDLC